MPQPGGGMANPMLPPPPPTTLFDIKVKRCIKSGEIKVATIPPEDFLTDPNATEVHEDKGRFYGDAARMTRSAAKLRWPKKKTLIDELPAYTEEDIVKQSRSKPWILAQTDKASEEIQIFECYVNCDYQGDGVASWWQVCIGGIAGGRKILSVEEWGGDLPYVSITPDPMPHRYKGRSVYDEVADVQRVKSVLLRQLLDNTYLVDNPMLAANGTAIENKDALINPKVGQIIWTNGPPGDAMVPVGIPYIGDKIFPSLEYFDMVIEKRTGVSRSTMALDLDTLQHQTATAVNAQQSAAFTKVETYARNISECGGFKELFSKLLKLFVQNQKSVKHIRSHGQWIALDPRGWKADMKVTINVGLGAGSRDRDMAMLGGIAQKQETAIQALGSPFNPVLNAGHLFDTYRRMVETGGLKSPEQYFPEYSQEQIQQFGQQFSQGQPPPPEMIKMQIEQAKMQADQQMRGMELQAEQQRDQNRAMLDQRAFEQKAQIEATQAQADVATTDRKAQADIMTNERKVQADIEMNTREDGDGSRDGNASVRTRKRAQDAGILAQDGTGESQADWRRRQDHSRSGNRNEQRSRSQHHSGGAGPIRQRCTAATTARRPADESGHHGANQGRPDHAATGRRPQRANRHYPRSHNQSCHRREKEALNGDLYPVPRSPQVHR